MNTQLDLSEQPEQPLCVAPAAPGSTLQAPLYAAIPNAAWIPPASILKCDKCGGSITGTAFGEIDASGSRFYHPHCKPPARGMGVRSGEEASNE
jgi:hypothetical protein